MDRRGYLFESRPQAVTHRKKFRDPAAAQTTTHAHRNLMHDKRVVRGSTYAPGNVFSAQGSQLDATHAKIQANRKAAAQRRREARKKAQESAAITIPGRVSVPVQTDSYLEDLMRQQFLAEQGTQTDPDPSMRKKPPVFKKKKLGISVGTTILPGDLFDFNIAIEPVLEVIVGKCLDQGSSEVIQEQSMKLIQAHHKEYSLRKRQMLDESRRLAAESQRRFEEKEALIRRKRAQFERERKLANKIASRNLSIRFMAGLPNSVLGHLEQVGYLTDPHKETVQKVFVPWLIQQVATELQKIKTSQAVVDEVLANTYLLALEERRADAVRIQKETERKEEASKKIQAERRRITKLQRQRAEEDRRYLADKAAAEKTVQEARAAAARQAEVRSDEGDDDGDGDDSD